MLFSRNHGKCRVTRIRRQLQDVFSAVAFLRARVSLNERTETQVAFVFGKTCVAPIKALTIPK